MERLITEERSEAAAEPLRPCISIVIPVYQTEEHLEACLFSAVFQTLPETEVVVVNDASPDGAQTIIDRFVSGFPDKVRAFRHEVNRGVSAARLTGTEQARAPYILFLDSDDLLSDRACEILWKEAQEQACDILCFAFERQDLAGGPCRTFFPPEPFSRESMIRHGSAAIWSAMYRRSLLLEHRELAFPSMVFEDAASTPLLVALAEKPGFCRESLYHYNTGREGSITTGRMSEGNMADMFRADEILWREMPPALRPALAGRIMARALANLRKYPEIFDGSLAHVRELMRLTGDWEDAYRPEDKRALKALETVPETPPIPKRVLVNGFLLPDLRDPGRYAAQARLACRFSPELVVLDEISCPQELLPAWLRGASPEEKGLYFALREMEARGGVYLAPTVTVTAGFHRERFHRIFFVAGPGNLVLPAVFGAEPGNPLLRSALDLAERGPGEGKTASLRTILSRVLIGEGGVHLSGMEEDGLHGLHMLPFRAVCRMLWREGSRCELDYSNLLAPPEGLVSLPGELDAFAWNAARDEWGAAAERIVSLERQLSEEKKKRAAAEKALRRAGRRADGAEDRPPSAGE